MRRNERIQAILLSACPGPKKRTVIHFRIKVIIACSNFRYVDDVEDTLNFGRTASVSCSAANTFVYTIQREKSEISLE